MRVDADPGSARHPFGLKPQRELRAIALDDDLDSALPPGFVVDQRHEVLEPERRTARDAEDARGERAEREVAPQRLAGDASLERDGAARGGGGGERGALARRISR
ncbi:hypothetical protein WME94_31265 [Sorangium sp. So ce429]